MSLKAGRLRHRVMIQEPADTRDPVTGEVIAGWREVCRVWAEVAPLSVREYISAQQLQSNITTRITVRYRAGLRADMRIIHRTAASQQIYNPSGWFADKDSGIDYLTAPCSLGVNQG